MFRVGFLQRVLCNNFWMKLILVGTAIQCSYLVGYRLAHVRTSNGNHIDRRLLKEVVTPSYSRVITEAQQQRQILVNKQDDDAISPTLNVRRNMTVEEFLVAYSKYCEQAFHPESNNLPACDCVPEGLEGRIQPMLEVSSEQDVLAEQSDSSLSLGGVWQPKKCSSRQRVAVIVPYRDRASHLLTLLNHLHPILQRQMLQYRIIVVEQVYPDIFNKAMMMNIGYAEAKKLGQFDCYIFHDVDVLAEDDRNFYTCAHHPRHVGAYLKKFNYTLKYEILFGAATAFTPEQFESCNGFSNEFYGWGGEDDDMSLRRRGRRRRPRHYPRDGLRNLEYTLTELTFKPLYTLVKAKIARPHRYKTKLTKWPKWKYADNANDTVT